MRLFVTLFLFLTFSAFGSEILSFSGGKVKAQVTWEKGPLDNQESVMMVELKSEETPKPYDIKVALYMPEMGHGSSPTKVEKIPQTNRYKVSKIFFTMPGTWEVRVTLKSEDGAKETQSFKVDI